jgi:hypothetical protein
MKKVSILILTAISVSFFSCSSDSGSSGKDTTDLSKVVVRKEDPGKSTAKTDTAKPVAKDTAAKAASQGPNSQAWSYTEEVDKMTSAKNYFAAIDAKDLLQFDSPYEGGSTATLDIRNMGKKNEAMLEISKGQFNSSVDGTTIKIRFDDEQPTTFSANEPSDGSTTVLFIGSPGKLIKKLKTAQKVIIQAEFYESGLRTMEFNVKGFKWDH